MSYINKKNICSLLNKANFIVDKGNKIVHWYTKIIKILRFTKYLETMQYLTYSMNDIMIWCNRFAKSIIDTGYRPDIIIFISKGGFLIGKEFANVFKVPLYEISTERHGNNAKSLLSPLFKAMPSRIRFWLIDMEMNIRIHSKKYPKRKIIFEEKAKRKIRNSVHKKILIVDDSVDTGRSAAEVSKIVHEEFPESDVKFASISVIHFSMEIFKTDFSLFQDTIIFTATSKDSKEYAEFIKMYENWRVSEG